MARLKYSIKPLQHGMATDYPSLYTQYGFSPAAVNVKIDQHSVKKPWGTLAHRAAGEAVYNICLFQLKDGTRHTIYLTATNALEKQTGVGETFSYITPTYTTGTASLSGTTVSPVGLADWSGVAAGDKFIFTADDSANVEPDTNWGTISANNGGGTTLTLTGAYTGATSSGAYQIRSGYTMPAGDRWSWAIVADKFCFTNGNVDVQSWPGSGYAAALDSTYATKARFCMEYANRLWLADTYDSGVRNPYLLRGSKENDPTNWTDSTAQDYQFLETDDVVTGLGKVGNSIIVYKEKSLLIGSMTGQPTDPLKFDIQRRGIGCIAPWSILEVMGTNVFLGKDDFYKIDGDYPVPIGETMRHKFYDIVEKTEATKTWGMVNHWQHECLWFANTSAGQYAFVWDYKTDEWFLYAFPTKITGAGIGAV